MRALLLMAFAASSALAQAPASAPPPAAAAPAQAPAQVAPAPEKTEQVSDPEKVRRSADDLGKMREVLRTVLGKLEEARNTKDVVKLNCVNEKLTQIKGLLRISEQADVALQEAVAKQEESSADHEYTKVTIASQKVNQLRAEAEECIGQLAFRTDENLTVEVETPQDLPQTDVTNPPPPPPIYNRPPPASPSL